MSGSVARTVTLRATALFVVWLALTLSLDAFYLGLGLVSAVAVAWWNTRPSARSAMRWSGLVVYLPWVLWQVLLSGTHVAYLILHPRLPIDPKLVRFTTTLGEPAAVVILGNSITLTPGTITAEVNSHELVVHAMDDASASGLGAMEARIADVFAVPRTAPPPR
jgi:multicomponent Na+:H+ antiporter subunit E